MGISYRIVDLRVVINTHFYTLCIKPSMSYAVYVFPCSCIGSEEWETKGMRCEEKEPGKRRERDGKGKGR